MKWSMIAYVCVFSLFVNQKSKCKGEDYWEKNNCESTIIIDSFWKYFHVSLEEKKRISKNLVF